MALAQLALAPGPPPVDTSTQKLGLQGMIENTVSLSQFDPSVDSPDNLEPLKKGDIRALSHALSAIESGTISSTLVEELNDFSKSADTNVPVLGITGTGGAGKSSLTDELIL